MSDAAAAPTPPRLYVATPCYGCVMGTPFLLSILRLQSECAARGIQCTFDFLGHESLVPRARCILAARCLKTCATHLLFIDADISFEPQAVLRLLQHDKDIVTCVYPRKSINWDAVQQRVRAGKGEPLHMAGLEYNLNITEPTADVEDGLVKVLDAATGFMLIRRGVLEKMNEVYHDELHCVNDLPGDRNDPMYPREYVALFQCMIDPHTRRLLSEDYSVCRRAQEAGFEVWCDIASPLCHTGMHVFEGDVRQRFTLTYAA